MSDFTKCHLAATGNVITAKARMSFPFLFNKDKDGKYQLTLVFPSNHDISLLKQEAFRVAKEKWGEDTSKHPKKLHSPFLDASNLDRPEYPEDAVVVRTSTKTPPGVVDAGKKAVTDETLAYPGRWCSASLSPSAYDFINENGTPSRGVKFYLQNVQLLDHDDPWSGAVKSNPDDEFEAVQDDGAEGGGDAAGAAGEFNPFG